MNKIFISYRREDSPGSIKSLLYPLEAKFGKERIFIDLDNISAGENIQQTIKDAINESAIFLLVIGKHWASLTKADGTRRLDDPKDYVRMEIQLALDKNVKIIPILLNDAKMPEKEDLPEEISDIVDKNAQILSLTHWDYDVNKLIEAMENTFSPMDLADENVTVRTAPDFKEKYKKNPEEKAHLVNNKFETRLNRKRSHVLMSLLIILVVIVGIGISLMTDPERVKFWISQDKTDDINKVFVIGGKNFLESNILLEIMAIMIEKDVPILKIKKIYNYGESINLFSGLKDGKIHLYPEYSGTILAQHLSQPYEVYKNSENHSKEYINKLIKKNVATKDLIWLDQFGFSNSYVLTMRRDLAEGLGIVNENGFTTISKLSSVSKHLIFKSTFGFFQRPDGFHGLVKEYDLLFKDTGMLLHEKKYLGLENQEMDVTDGYETDPQIFGKDKPFIKIKDDKEFFPKYYPGPFLNQIFLESYPKIGTALGKLSNRIEQKDLASLMEKFHKKGLKSHQLNTAKTAQNKLRTIVLDFLKQKRII